MTASRQWATRPSDERYETLDSLFEAVNKRRFDSMSEDLPVIDIQASVTSTGDDIQLNHGMKAVVPTHWSFGQLANRIGAPAHYLRDLPANLAVSCINHGIHKLEKDKLKFMTIVNRDNDESIPNRLQAVTSTTYGRIWDADVVKECKEIVQRTNGKFYNPKALVDGVIKPSGLYASDRDVFIFMIDGGSVFDIGPRAQLNRGFFMWNSEVGNRTFGLTTFLFNSVCQNHICWGAQDIKDIRIRHTQNGPYRFGIEAAPSLLAYANASAAPVIDTIKRAQDYLLPDTQEKVITWLREKGFAKSEAIEGYNTAVKEEGDCRTLWQVVQGLTAYARGFDFIDARVDLETRAGDLLNIVKS